MRLRHIEILEAILRTGSLTNAAKALHISQPAASKLLASAEWQVGYKLFDRVKGRLQPTPEVRLLGPSLARLHNELSQIRRLATGLRHSAQGHLRIGSTPAMGLALLPEAIHKTTRTHPDVTFDLRTQHSSELIQSLAARELDIVVTFDPAPHPGLDCDTIGHTLLVHVGRRARQRPVALSELADFPYIALEMNDPAGALLQHALEQSDLALDISIQVQTHYMACALVAAGCGETVVDYLTAHFMQSQGLIISALCPSIAVPINVMTRTYEPLSSTHQTLIDNLRAVSGHYQSKGDQMVHS